MSGNTQISASTGGTITLKLPSGLTCNHCVFQVKNLKNIKAKFTRLKIKEINFFYSIKWKYNTGKTFLFKFKNIIIIKE
jgi:hypothetical protein